MFIRSLFCSILILVSVSVFAQQGKPATTNKTAPQEEIEIVDLDAFKPKPIDTLTAPTVIAFGYVIFSHYGPGPVSSCLSSRCAAQRH